MVTAHEDASAQHDAERAGLQREVAAAEEVSETAV
jgi:hypothetical protein